MQRESPLMIRVGSTVVSIEFQPRKACVIERIWVATWEEPDQISPHMPTYKRMPCRVHEDENKTSKSISND